MPGFDRISLPDGRSVDVSVTGSSSGLPLVFHHGTPGAAIPFRAIQRAAHERGLRFVTFSRPGYGDSSRRAHRTVADVVPDTAAVLRAIGADSCLVAGWSGGGPHALACGAGLAQVKAVLVIAGVAPFDSQGLDWMAGMGEENVAEFGAASQGEAPLRRYLEMAREHLKDVSVEGIITGLESLLPEVDKAVLTEEFGQDMAASFHEALRIGVDGWLDDDLAFVRPWGFEPQDVSVPVALWQGSLDLMVPYTHGKWLAGQLPGASVHLEEGEGHLSIGVGRVPVMLDELLDLAR